MFKLTQMVMSPPYGVCALMAWMTGKYGVSLLLPLLKVTAPSTSAACSTCSASTAACCS